MYRDNNKKEYRQTNLQQFIDCKFKFKLVYCDNILLSSPWMKMGTIWHKCVELFITEGKPTLTTLLEHVSSLQPTEWNSIFKLCSEFNLDLTGENLHVEKKLKAEFPFFGFSLVGTPDLVTIEENRAEILDYKSGYRIPTKVEFDNMLQPITYAYLVWKVFKVPIIETNWWYMRYNKVLHKKFNMVEEASLFENKISFLIADIKAEQRFKKNLNHCPKCYFWGTKFCSTPVRKEYDLTVLKQRKQIAAHLQDLEKRVKTVREQLKESCQEHGAIEVRGKVLALHNGKSLTWKTKEEEE